MVRTGGIIAKPSEMVGYNINKCLGFSVYIIAKPSEMVGYNDTTGGKRASKIIAKPSEMVGYNRRFCFTCNRPETLSY